MNYCGMPSIAKLRNFAYLSAIFRASTYAADLRHALYCSMLSHCQIATRDFGGVPSIAVIFCPAARMRPPPALIAAWASGTYSFK